MYQIKTYNQISPKGLDAFPKEQYAVGSEMSQPDAIMVRSAALHDEVIPASVKAIGRVGAGVNNIPVARLTGEGIPVFNAPGANANAVKELVLVAMLMMARKIKPAMQFVDDLDPDASNLGSQVEGGKKQFVGFELPGKVLGVIGLGAIGVNIANAARSLGMQVIGYDPQITVEAAWRLTSDVKQAKSVPDLLKASDFVTVHVPLIEQTRNLINSKALNTMKKGAMLLNFSRGGIVNDDDVLAALMQDKLQAYACDFPAKDLIGHSKVLALPHLGASTREAEENCAMMIVDQLQNYLENGNIKNSVNFPEIELPRTDGARLVVINANVPNMVGQISTLLGEAGINIVELLNKSRGELAISLVDIEGDLSAETIAALEAITGVLSVRSLPANKS